MTREDPPGAVHDTAPELPSSFDAPADRGRVRDSARRRTAGAPAARPSRAPRVPFAVLLIGLLVGGLALLLLLNTASAANELSRHDLAQQDVGVAAQVQQLQNDVAASAAPANLARAAGELGMVPAADPAFLIVGADGKVGVRGSAAPASAAPVPVPAATKSKSKSKPKAKPTAKNAKSAPPKSTATPKNTTKSTATPKATASRATASKATASKGAPSNTRSAASSPGGNR